MSRPLGPPATGAPTTVEDVLDLVRAQGGRATSSRRALLQVLFDEEDHHLTAEDLAAAVQARVPDVHLSTIYRNLEELQRLGVVVHSHLGHGPATYQLASLAHAHFVCDGCGAMVEVPDMLWAAVAATALADTGFEVDPLHFAIPGRCAMCRSGH
jgi:Fur family ferric uptake transcriptional regulator